MLTEVGDEYVRRIAAFVRSNEPGLAEAGPRRRRSQRPSQSSALNPLSWFDSPVKPVVLSLDTHHLFYLLMRLEGLGFNVGSLDIQIECPSRPMSYINLFPEADKSDSLSLASFRSSLSAVSGFSLGGGWWGRPEPPTVDADLKYLYRSFNILPALSIVAPGRRVIAELANDPPIENGVPLDAFKNLMSLECIDIDPRSIIGWDRLADSLRSLKIRKSGLEDISEIFIGAVLDDQARRGGSTSRKRQRRIPHGPLRRTSFYSTQLPDSVPEAAEDNVPLDSESPQSQTLPSSKWTFLKQLALPDNAFTFFPTDIIPYLTSLTHLDLSCNLLNSIPSGLGSLYNLISLNLSDNMIDSVMGISTSLGQVLELNLSHNRLESICGLERLPALEKVDLRSNQIEESTEIGRLATLPNISHVLVEGNPFTEYEEGYRVICFDLFIKEGKEILLDNAPPGFYERRNLTTAPTQQTIDSRPVSAAYSPPVVAVGQAKPFPTAEVAVAPTVPSKAPDKTPSLPSSSATSPSMSPVGKAVVAGKAWRKRAKRIVDLDGEHSESTTDGKHHRMKSDGSAKENRDVTKEVIPPQAPLENNPARAPVEIAPTNVSDTQPAVPSTAEASIPTRGPQRRTSRHSRYHTEYAPSQSDFTPLDRTNEGSEQPTAPIVPLSSASFKRLHGTQTFASRSAARRARVTASVFDQDGSTSDVEERRDSEAGMEAARDSAEAYRRRIEALKKDMGEGWLKVFSQTQLKTPSG